MQDRGETELSTLQETVDLEMASLRIRIPEEAGVPSDVEHAHRGLAVLIRDMLTEGEIRHALRGLHHDTLGEEHEFIPSCGRDPDRGEVHVDLLESLGGRRERSTSVTAAVHSS